MPDPVPPFKTKSPELKTNGQPVPWIDHGR